MKKEKAPKQPKRTTAKDSAHGKTLVIVESPAKAKTINKYLGKNYLVEASVGHIRDLIKFRMGIDIENGFEPKYITVRGKADIIKKFKKDAAAAENVLLATDPDREGEAIAWHISEEIKSSNSNIKRVIFNEITKNSIKNSINSPRDIDINMFKSQQARRVMDRIIGFKVSPFLANTMLDKTTETLSAGRVQSVAIRLICEREEAINKFESIDYWVINANFLSENDDNIASKLVAFDGNIIKNPDGSKKGDTDSATANIKSHLDNLHYIKSEEQANQLISRIKQQDFRISEIAKKQITRKPSSPFTTSLLQQDASRKLGFSNKKTMTVAQRLYEGVNIGSDGAVGLITYMRTDSVRVAPEAIGAIREFIGTNYGQDYVPPIPPVYKSKSTNIQDAHEAIRPTMMHYTPSFVKQYLDKDEFALYSLIYNRFTASQMSPAKIDQTTVNITSRDFNFRATGSVIVFNGFLVVYDYQSEEELNSPTNLPKGLAENQATKLQTIEHQASSTRPPARYNEASLVKEMDELGIGRPSTYAQIVSTLLDRKYVELFNKAFIPTELGNDVCKVLVTCFPDLFNVDFTAKMEEELDSIAEGNLTYLTALQSFYTPFEVSLQQAEERSKSIHNAIICEKCGGEMTIKVSRNGRFLGCSNWPDCDNTMSIYSVGKSNKEKPEPEIAEGIMCSLCGSQMVIREGKYGKFYGCSAYPKCKNIKPLISSIPCPKCGDGFITSRFSTKSRKKFWSCSRYPDCDYLSNNEPILETCPKCGNNTLEYRFKKVASGFEKYKACPKCKEKFEDKSL